MSRVVVNFCIFIPSGALYHHFIEFFHELFTGSPDFSTGVDPFSNANIYALDQLKAETKTDLESPSCPLLSPILH